MANSLGPFSSMFQGMFGGPDINQQSANVDTSGTQKWLNQPGTNTNFNNALGMHLATAQGRGPSAATDLLKQQTQNTLANTNALASSGSGNVGAGVARRNAMLSGASQLQNLGAQAAAQRSAEQLGAENMYGNLAATQRGQDIQAANVTANQADTQAQIQAQQNIANMQAAQNSANNGSQLFSGLVGAAASAAPLLMMSDENAKEPVNEGRFNVRQPATFGDAQFQEPGKPEVAFTLREEPFGLLGINRYTGEYGKVPLIPLDEKEHYQAFERPHGAGGLNSPDRKRTVMHDGDFNSNPYNVKMGPSSFGPEADPREEDSYGSPVPGYHNNPSKFHAPPSEPHSYGDSGGYLPSHPGLTPHDQWRISQGMAPESRSGFPGYNASSDIKGDESIEDYMSRNWRSSPTGDQQSFYGASDPEKLRAQEDSRVDRMAFEPGSGDPDQLFQQYQQANASSIPKWRPPDHLVSSKDITSNDAGAYKDESGWHEPKPWDVDKSGGAPDRTQTKDFYGSPIDAYGNAVQDEKAKAAGNFAHAMGHITTGSGDEQQPKITGELYHDADFYGRGYSDNPRRDLEIMGGINSDESKKSGASAPFFRDVDPPHHVPRSNELSGASDSIWSDFDSKMPSSGSPYADGDIMSEDYARGVREGLKQSFNASHQGDKYSGPIDVGGGDQLAPQPNGQWDYQPAPMTPPDARPRVAAHATEVHAKQHFAQPAGEPIHPAPPPPSPMPGDQNFVGPVAEAGAPSLEAKENQATLQRFGNRDDADIISDAYRKEDPSHFGDESGHPRRTYSEVGPEPSHEAAVHAVTHHNDKTAPPPSAGPGEVEPAHNNNEGAIKPHVGNMPDQDAVQPTPNNDQHGAGTFQHDPHPNSGMVIPGPISGGYGPPHEAGQDARKPRDWELNGDGSAVYGSDPGVSGIISDEDKKISMDKDRKLGENVKRAGEKDPKANMTKQSTDTGDRGGKEQAEAKRGDKPSERKEHNSQHTPSRKDDSSYGASPKKTERTDPYGAKNFQFDGKPWYHDYFKKQDAGPPWSDGQSWGRPGNANTLHPADLDLGKGMSGLPGMSMNHPMHDGDFASQAGMHMGPRMNGRALPESWADPNYYRHINGPRGAYEMDTDGMERNYATRPTQDPGQRMWGEPLFSPDRQGVMRENMAAERQGDMHNAQTGYHTGSGGLQFSAPDHPVPIGYPQANPLARPGGHDRWATGFTRHFPHDDKFDQDYPNPGPTLAERAGAGVGEVNSMRRQALSSLEPGPNLRAAQREAPSGLAAARGSSAMSPALAFLMKKRGY